MTPPRIAGDTEPVIAGESIRTMTRALADLAVPLQCGGCGRPDVPWCARCATRLADVPRALRPRVDPEVPAWALGRYDGPLRAAVLALKEHGRRDLVSPLGAALARGLVTLAEWGELPAAGRLLLVPAPTRTMSARRRGGDPVTAVAEEAAARLGARVAVRRLLVTAPFARDSAGLGAGARSANLAGAVTVIGRPPSVLRRAGAVVVDDVSTTGATAAASVRALRRAGVEPVAVVVVAGA